MIPYRWVRNSHTEEYEVWHMFTVVLKINYRDFSGGPVIKTRTSPVGGIGSIPSQGTKILHVMWRGQKKKKLIAYQRPFHYYITNSLAGDHAWASINIFLYRMLTLECMVSLGLLRAVTVTESGRIIFWKIQKFKYSTQKFTLALVLAFHCI